MRLRKDQIQKISEKVLKDLQAHKLAILKVDAHVILERIQKAITDDLLAEDRLGEEIKNIMEKYRAQISSGQMNEQEVFQMIKRQLVKERKLTI